MQKMNVSQSTGLASLDISPVGFKSRYWLHLLMHKLKMTIRWRIDFYTLIEIQMLIILYTKFWEKGHWNFFLLI